MKKIVCLMGIVFMFLCLSCFPACGYADGTASRELTVMIYMCGGNLESRYGLASEDILEIESSGFSEEKTAVLALMGGSDDWKLLSSSTGNTATMLEIGSRPGRNRILWQSEQMNMGDSQTLTRLLKYGMEYYPAEHYALILWNHGGGPLEGICWDELFSLDQLTLDELTEGLRMAYVPGKLSWIGFDACLMGSAEVAAAVAPYADYMIASEETEPGCGWNYRFLKDADGDGAKTGRQIVDSYFEALQDSQDPLTMACIDLRSIDNVVKAMDEFFPGIEESISKDSFPDLSRIRSSSCDFGQAVRAAGGTDYDLVDLADLTYGLGGEGSAVSNALRKSVVYVRSNVGKAGGLSVYHPYANKKKYLETWRDNYRRLSFSAAYSRYVEHFGAVLTGEEYVDWSRMKMSEQEALENGSSVFHMQLTEPQAAEYLSGELVVMALSPFAGDKLSLAPIASVPATIDENGGLTAAYTGKALYIENEKGEVLRGPVSYLLSGDGAYLILTDYHDYSSREEAKNDTIVLYYCTPDESTGNLEIIRTYVFDPVSQTYTNRIPFTEDGFTDVDFHYYVRDLPDTERAIPAFNEWKWFEGYTALSLSLPCNWHLTFRDAWGGSEMYAMFQITTVHQNRWCSIPIKITNPMEKQILVKESIPDTEGIEIHCSSAVVMDVSLKPSLQIQVKVQNDTDRNLVFSGSAFVLNGTRSTDERLYLKARSKNTGEDKLILDQENLKGLDQITSVDFLITVSDSDDFRAEPTVIPVHLDLSGEELGSIAQKAPEPLDTYRDGDTVWQLISLQQEKDGRMSGQLHVQQTGDTALQMTGMLLINGIQSGDTIHIKLGPGMDAYIPFRTENRDTVSHFSLHVNGRDALYTMGVYQAMEQAGITVADQLEIYPDHADGRITLRVPEGVQLQAPDKVPEPILLLDDEGCRVFMEQLLIADDGIGIGLRLQNDSNEMICLEAVKPFNLNGTVYEGYNPEISVMMPPGSRAVKCLVLQSYDEFEPGSSVENLSFRFRIGDQPSSPATIHFPAGIVFGAEGGTYLNGAETEVTPAVFSCSP